MRKKDLKQVFFTHQTTTYEQSTSDYIVIAKESIPN